ncbi:MAG: DUF45 domain-containing protein [Clostridia bacterium]|nr:DUF45 domain-containing protein [Clostridia bacterium]
MKRDIQFQGYMITLQATRNARYLRLSYYPDRGTFHLSVPWWAKEEDIRQYLEKNSGWMQEKRKGFQGELIRYEAGEKHMVLGKPVTLGEDNVPCGAVFVRWRIARLEALVRDILPEWEDTFGVKIRGITLQNTTSIWGSYRYRTQKITLSTRLAMYPPECTEFVLIHELNHVRHPDHSKAFYEDMNRYMLDWQKWDAVLKTLDVRPVPASR